MVFPMDEGVGGVVGGVVGLYCPWGGVTGGVASLGVPTQPGDDLVATADMSVLSPVRKIVVVVRKVL